MVGFPGSVCSLNRWFLLLLLLLNMPLQVILAMLESHSRQSQNPSGCTPDEYRSKDFCCKRCPAGMFVQEHCTIPHTKGKCESCEPGMFTKHNNGLESCIHCSTCDKRQEMVADCSATSDRKCQCQTHYYYDPKCPELCQPCTKCPQGIPVLQECNSTANTVCSRSASNITGPRNRLSPLSMLIIAFVVYYIIRR
ncbi:tumor necrosis factor receptor superfamily member 23-like isoform X2 [Arvicanthis niloticus]|uniref:tumor necrosis factor receptor superfamily member 23-like isoform X2 n=1 Tax=Arvicanthis niloticus TaxID=61156 RepID=UPI001486E79D|nr:tumor necrosis factor receptor superfamily member 22-like isoform X2 [Arvicanthis niloticus]